jgi:type IV fimbrial biogenesis protein FimT
MMGKHDLTRALQRRNGMTMIELLVVVGILGVLAALAAPSLNQYIMAKRVEGVATELIADFRLARTNAIQMNTPQIVRFRDNTALTCYTIYSNETASGSCDCRRGAGSACTGDPGTTPPEEVKTLSLPLSGGIKLTPSVDRFRYSAATQMITTGSLSIVVEPASSDGAGGSMRIDISSTGRPVLCAVSGHPGYPACPQASGS